MPTKTPPFFGTAVFLSLSIGVPFCIFKALFGLLCIEHGLAPAGWGLIAWAGTDLALNLSRSLNEFLGARKGMGRPEGKELRAMKHEFCLLAELGRLLGRPTAFLALDTLLSFLIICTVLWSGWIADLPPWGRHAWLTATTVNLLSLAFVNIWLGWHADRPADGKNSS